MRDILKKAAGITFVGMLMAGGLPAISAQEAGEMSILVPGYDGGYLQEELDNGIADFQEETGATVNVISVGWDEVNSRIVQLAQAGQSPDVLLIGTRSLRQFSDEGIIVNVEDYITEEFVEPRVESVFLTANIDGQQFGVPMAFSSRAFYYRSDLIDTPPADWEELLETARSLKEEYPDMYTFYLPIDGPGTSIELMSFFYQNEGYILNEAGEYEVNNPANVETLEYLAQFVVEDLVPNPLESERDDAAQMFINGDLAMFFTGPWEKEVLDEAAEEYPYATSVLPEGKVPGVNIATDSYVITEGAQNPELAWDFIEFMGQEDYQRPVSEAFDWFPILEAEVEDERFQTDFMIPFVEMIPYGQPDPHTTNWDFFHQHFNLAIQEALTGTKTAQEALDDAQAALSQE